jgi:hypothetical protein
MAVWVVNLEGATGVQKVEADSAYPQGDLILLNDTERNVIAILPVERLIYLSREDVFTAFESTTPRPA